MEKAAAPHRAVTQVPISDEVLRAVYASDQDMYPVALPYDRLRAWVAACPELSICFRDSASDTSAGVIIALPLRLAHWEKLVSGQLKEPDIDPGAMFPESGVCRDAGEDGSEAPPEEEIGLHIYHVERFPAGEVSRLFLMDGGTSTVTKRFSEYAVEALMRRAQARREWKVVGISALTATPAGRRAFKRMGFRATGYREVFVVKAGARPSADGNHNSDKEVEMVCLYYDDETVQVPSEKAGQEGAIASISEMMVKSCTAFHSY
ncbi:hypothetical protein VTK56DRAFT_4027 [Thermocarpiscus australiensis]